MIISSNCGFNSSKTRWRSSGSSCSGSTEPNGEPDGFVQPTWQPQSVSDDPVWLPGVRALVGRDRKIEAIKRVREYTGWGLAEAKQYVDRL